MTDQTIPTIDMDGATLTCTTRVALSTSKTKPAQAASHAKDLRPTFPARTCRRDRLVERKSLAGIGLGREGEIGYL